MSDKKINERNKKIITETHDECISIFNDRCHPYLEAGLFTLGQFLNPDKKIIDYHSMIFKLEGTKAPRNQIRGELEITLKKE